MFKMFIDVPERTSEAVSKLSVDALAGKAVVTFQNGLIYAYKNVSKRAIINVLFNPDISLGFWVNRNLVRTDRAELMNGDEFDYATFSLKSYKEPELPSFV